EGLPATCVVGITPANERANEPPPLRLMRCISLPMPLLCVTSDGVTVVVPVRLLLPIDRSSRFTKARPPPKLMSNRAGLLPVLSPSVLRTTLTFAPAGSLKIVLSAFWMFVTSVAGLGLQLTVCVLLNELLPESTTYRMVNDPPLIGPASRSCVCS